MKKPRTGCCCINVYILSDMEGISLVTEWEQVQQEHPFYPRYRHILTDEVNAAIEGALDAGAKRIVVNDGHGSSDYNLLWEKLHSDILIERPDSGGNIFPSMMTGQFDALLLIGYHAMEGAPNAVLPHTQNRETLRSYTINGRLLGEIGQMSLIAGSYQVPVAFISGDRAAVQEARALLGEGLPAVEVKWGHTNGKATCLHPNTVKRSIRETVKLALSHIEVAPYRMQSPYKIEIQLKTEAAASWYSARNGVERVDTLSVVKCVEEASKILDFS